MRREIIHIDEEKCNGCGLCVPNCAEGALQIVNGKARLVAENLCDGLGACLGECPRGALTIEVREADAFDEEAVRRHLQVKENNCPNHGGCPGSMTRVLKTKTATEAEQPGGEMASELAQWPVQLKLVNPNAPYFRNADLLIAADCVPFACADFHRRFLRGRAVAVGCPKLDDAAFYLEKLTEMIRNNNFKSITIAYMEVPCCGGLVRLVREAARRAGVSVPITEVKVPISVKA